MCNNVCSDVIIANLGHSKRVQSQRLMKEHNTQHFLNLKLGVFIAVHPLATSLTDLSEYC